MTISDNKRSRSAHTARVRVSMSLGFFGAFVLTQCRNIYQITHLQLICDVAISLVAQSRVSELPAAL